MYRFRIIIFLIFIFHFSFSQNEKIFDILENESTQISFKNIIEETDSINIMKTGMPYLYAGGGVAILDVNNDGLQDIFLLGNQTASKLYINKGNLKFEDKTNEYGIQTSSWSTAVITTDVNNDGWTDLYILKAQNNDERTGGNQLFINMYGLSFKEESSIYNLNLNGRFLAGSFFDYDSDGDLDLYLARYPDNSTIGNDINFDFNRSFKKGYGTDMLLENINSKFVNVNTKAGILDENGFGISVITADFNNDYLTDIYVGNDFADNDYLYINNGNKTFTESIRKYFNHTSFFTMGLDFQDMDNDGLSDLISLDMNPPALAKYKLDFSSFDFEIYKATERNYNHQEIRNCLQFQNSDGTFADFAQIDKVAFTDWSWTPLIADFDLNGTKDIFITNGLKRDILNQNIYTYQLDSILRFQNRGWEDITDTKKLSYIPPSRLYNYLFSNLGNRSFENKSIAWANQKTSVSTGAALADLDNDGDVDIVVNNIDTFAQLYKNNSMQNNKKFIKFICTDLSLLGSKITLKTNLSSYHYEVQTTRGFISSSQAFVVFGIQENEQIEYAKIDYNSHINKTILIDTLKINQTYDIKYYLLNDTSNISVSHNPFKYKIDTISRFIPNLSKSDFRVQPFLLESIQETSPIVLYKNFDQINNNDLFVGAFQGQKSYILLFNNDQNNKIYIPNSQDNTDIDCETYLDNNGHQTIIILSKSSIKDSIYYQITSCYLKNNKVIYTVLWKGNDAYNSISILKKDNQVYMVCFGATSLQNYPFNSLHSVYNITTGSIVLENNYTKQLNLIYKNHNISSTLNIKNQIYIAGHFEPVSVLSIDDLNHLKKEVIYHKCGFWTNLDYDEKFNTLLVTNIGLNFRFNLISEDSLILYINDFDKNNLSDPIVCASIQGKEYPIYNYKDFTSNLSGVRKFVPEIKHYFSKTIQEIYKDIDYNSLIKKSINTVHNILIDLDDKNISDSIPQFTNLNSHCMWNNKLIFAGNNYNTRPDFGYNYAAAFIISDIDNIEYNINNLLSMKESVNKIINIFPNNQLLFTTTSGVYLLTITLH